MTSKASGVLFQQRETDLFCFVYKSLCIQREALLTPVLGADLLITPFLFGIFRQVHCNERSSVFTADRTCPASAFGSSSALCSEQSSISCAQRPLDSALTHGDNPSFTSPEISSPSQQDPAGLSIDSRGQSQLHFPKNQLPIPAGPCRARPAWLKASFPRCHRAQSSA